MKIPFSRRTVFAFLAMPFLTVAACGTSTNDGGGSSCTPGQQINCGCGNRGQGVQVCLASGTYGSCACGDDGGGAEAGTDATISEDGAIDSGSNDGTIMDGSASDSGDAGPTNVCSIGGAVYAAGAVNPSNPCQSCEPGASKTVWTTTNGVNASCPAQEVCSGTCQAGCWIDGSFSASGATSNNGCEACTPASSTTAWTSVTGAASCPSTEVCNGGTCASGCFISGAYYAAGATMNSGCETCTPASSTSSWTNASNGKSCGGGQVCGSGVCGTQCDIAGTGIVASGAVNPSNPCQSCQPGTSTTTWTSTDGVNTSCPTGDVCSGTTASCSSGCWISGAFVAVNALNPSNPCQSCSPSGTGGTTMWTNTDGVNASCPAAEVCNGQPATCTSGCYIAGSFHAATAIANNGCEVCTPASSTSSWTDVTGGASCPGGEVCQAGACAAGDDAGGGGDGGPGTLNWAENFGITGQTFPEAVALDPSSSDIVVAGYYWGSTNFGGGTLASIGDGGSGNDAFVARFDSSGHYKWAKTYGNGSYVGASSATVDANGQVIVAGTFQGSLDFGCGTLTAAGNDDIFLVSFSTGGTCMWSKRFGSSGNYQGVDSVVADGSGNVLIAGGATAADFGGGAKTGFYIAKFESTGAYQWSDAFVATTTQGGPWLSVDPSGNAVLAGSFNTTVNFGGGTLTSAGSADAFVAKFNSSGAYQWAKQYGDSSEQDVSGVATDGSGDIFVTGNFGGTISFGTGTLVGSTTASKDFLAKLDPTGSGVWATAFSGAGSSPLSAGSVAADSLGGVTLTSHIGAGGSVDYGGGTLASAGSFSVAVATFDSSGDYRWSYVGGAPSTADQSSPAYGTAVAANSTTVIVVGDFGTCAATGCTRSPPGTTLVLSGRPLTAISVQDLFLATWTL